MAKQYTAEEMRQMAGSIVYERSVEYFPDVEKIAAMLRQAADALDGIRDEISSIEKMPTADLDGAFEHQKVNGDRLMAKIAFYDKVKALVAGGA